MIMHNLKILSLAVLLFWPGSLPAQQSDTLAPLRLTYAQALELADRDNPQIQTALVNVEKARAQVGEAWSAALPSLSASGLYTRNFVVPEVLVTIPGQETVKFQFQQANVWAGQIQLSQTLYSAGRVGLGLQIARLFRENAQEGVRLSRSQVKLLVTQLYFGAVLAQQGRSIAQQTYQQILDHLRVVQLRQSVGLVSEYDLIRSQVQASNFYPQVLASETNRTVAFQTLAIALGLPRGREIELADNMSAYVPPRLPSESDYYIIAVQRRPELRQLDLQTHIQQKLITVEKHGVWWPILALGGGYTVNAQASDFHFGEYYWSRNLFANLALSIPLFDSFKARYRAQQVRADLKNLLIQRDQLEKNVNLEIIQARDRFVQAQKNVAAQEEGVRLAQKGLDIANTQYASGVTTQLGVMDAQIALNQAQMNLLSAHYDLIVTQAQLEKALGGE